MIPDHVTTIVVKSEAIVDWQSTIELKSDALALLEKVAGPTPDSRFFNNVGEVDFDNETWGWSVNWNSALDSPSKMILLWFKDPRHAVYFKTLWGGQ